MDSKTITIEGTAEERKQIPLYRGLMCYFPNALVEVAKQSYKGNIQHHPEDEIWWDMSKSKDELDALLRHMLEGEWGAVAWRALAHLERSCIANKDHNRKVQHE